MLIQGVFFQWKYMFRSKQPFIFFIFFPSGVPSEEGKLEKHNL